MSVRVRLHFQTFHDFGVNNRRSQHNFIARLLAPRFISQLFIQDSYFVQILLGEFLQVQQGIVRPSRRTNDFVQLELDRHAVTILSVLNQEDHQERHNGRRGIDDQFPGIAEMGKGAANRPD